MNEPTLKEYIKQRLKEGVEAALAADPTYTCPLCGQHEVGHDQAACDAKMAAWRPVGLLNSPDNVVTGAPIDYPEDDQ